MTSLTNTKKSNSINLWSIILAALAILGAICWGIQLSKGLQVTNLGTSNMWGLYIVGFMIFTGVAAGSLLWAAVPYLFNLNEYKPYSRIAAFTGAVSVLVAGLFILVDIGTPWKAWLFITSGNFASPMFWDFIMLALYIIIAVIFTGQLLKVHRGEKEENSIKAIAIIAFVAGLLVVVTSFVFSMQVARPLWNSPVQSISFLIAALVAALAILMIIFSILSKTSYLKMPPELLAKMAKVTALLLGIQLIIVIGEVLIGLYPGAGSGYEATLWLVTGKGALGFWLEIVALVAAIIILSKTSGSSQMGTIILGALLALISIYLIKSNLLQAEFFNSLISLPGPPMFGDTAGRYIPSLVEIGLSLGIISLGALIFKLGLNKLNLGE